MGLCACLSQARTMEAQGLRLQRDGLPDGLQSQETDEMRVACPCPSEAYDVYERVYSLLSGVLGAHVQFLGSGPSFRLTRPTNF